MPIQITMAEREASEAIKTALSSAKVQALAVQLEQGKP